MGGRLRVAAAVVAACLAGGLAGCGTNPQLALVGTPTPDPLTATATAPTPAPGVIAPTPGPLRVLTGPPSHGATSLPWSLQQLGADGRTLTIYFPASCVAIAGVQLTETTSAVTLTVWGVTGSGACAASLAYGFGAVTLTAPLGDRALLHAPVSRGWAETHLFG